MLVSFKFECLKHGEFDHYFNTVQYPDRNFPFYTVMCPEEGCNRLAQYIPYNTSAVRDDIGDGKVIDSLGVFVRSKSWLKRYLKTEGISQLTSDELSHKQHIKSSKQRIKEKLDAKNKERKEFLSKELDKYGVIDGVK